MIANVFVTVAETADFAFTRSNTQYYRNLKKNIYLSIYYMGNEENCVLMKFVITEFAQYAGDYLNFPSSRCSEMGRQKLAKKAASAAVWVINSAWTICSSK